MGTGGTGPDSEFDIVTTDLASVAVFAEHVPIEFERTRHYFYDAAGTDIEPVAESLAFEWSGVFSLDGTTTPCKWSMQADDNGDYPDPSMLVVIIPTSSTPTEATMNSKQSDAVGETMLPPSGGACYILTASTTGPDSEFDINTVGI